MWRKRARLAPMDALASMSDTSPVQLGSVKRPPVIRRASTHGPSSVHDGPLTVHKRGDMDHCTARAGCAASIWAESGSVSRFCRLSSLVPE